MKEYKENISYHKKGPKLNALELKRLVQILSDIILFLLFTKTNLQLYFKLPVFNSEEVIVIFDRIEEKLGKDLFKETFECIFTDRGRENKDPYRIERDSESDELLRKVFYCAARRSEPKGKCEKNHEHFSS